MNNAQRTCSPLSHNSVVERGLDLKMRANRAKYFLKWGSVNALLLAVLLFDISNKCPNARSSWYYVEYAAALLLGLSVVACFAKYLYLVYLFHTDPVHGTKQQRSLLQFEDNDNSFVTDAPVQKRNVCESSDANAQQQQVNSTILSWHSSFNDSRGPAVANWSYCRNTPPRQSLSPQQLANASWQNSSSMLNNSALNASALSSNASFMSPYLKYAREDLILDERGLQQYLREVAKREYTMSETVDLGHNFQSGSINSFWNYCNTAANLLKTSLYQLAPSTTPSTPNKQTTTDEGGLNILDSNSEVIKRISSEKLSQYVANLRRWISVTILHRLTKEIENIDASFKHRGLIDMQIGSIALERLRKTVENQPFVNHFMPMLPLIFPFLEMSSNQEYLVQRIKDLAKGSCIADYQWNAGSDYNGVKWDEQLPTDSAILFHLFCVYLDSQLMPLPQGGGRPFFCRYVVMGAEKRSAKDTIATVQNKAHCGILCTNALKPKFNFISDKEIHTCAYDRNNLFYVIIQFLIYMKTHHESALESVNLGRSGINIMCVIED